jgi:hypothetical protein
MVDQKWKPVSHSPGQKIFEKKFFEHIYHFNQRNELISLIPMFKRLFFELFVGQVQKK